MAISGGDGSIILTTKVDTSGISKGSLSIRSALQGVDNTVKKVQNSFSAFREQKVTLATLTQAIKDQNYALETLKTEHANLVAAGKGSSTQAKQLKGDIDALTVELKEMEGAAATLGAKGSTSINKIGTAMKTLLSYFIGIQTIFKVINFSGEAAKFATQTEASVQRLVDIYGEATQSVGDFIDANARAIGMSKASASSFASVYGNLFSVWADQNTNAELTNRYLNMTAVVASKTGRTVQDVQERIRSGLLGNTEAIEDLGVFVNVKTIEMTNAFQRMADGKSWEQLDAYTQQQVRTMAILEQATAKYGNTVADTTATTRAQYQAAYEDFQNTWGQVVNTVLIPVLKILTQVFTIATKGLQVMAGLTGKTVDNSKIQENSIGGAVDNQKELTKEIEKTNKAQKKSLAAFDEINILSQETAENSSDTGGANVPITGGGGGESYNNSFVDKIDADLAAIMGYVGFALVAIGVLLICFGHIGWGIGFIIAGAAIFSVSQAALSEGAEAEKVKNIMNGIIAGVSLLALVLGIILVCTTKNPKAVALGIGLIVVGAAGLATEIALNWNAIKENVQKFFTENGALIAGISFGLLVIGVLLCFAHQWGLGIGLIAAGAVGLAATVALNWNAIKDNIQKFFTENGWLIAGVSLALLVIGVLLCFAQIWGLGIGLIAAGATGLVATVALNWNTIKEKVSNAFNAVINWVKTYGLLVIGILLCLTGAGIPSGIALIVKWAKDGVKNGVPLANVIVTKVKEVWNAVKQFWNTHIAPIFTARWWANLAKKALNGCIGVFEAFLNHITSGFRNLANTASSLINVIGGALGLDWNIPQIPKIKLPRLAKGAVIPPNREFLAVLGDQKQGMNIEAPAELIKKMAMEAMLEVGATGQTTKEEHYYLNETELMTILHKLVKGGERLQGPSLISGGAH